MSWVNKAKSIRIIFEKVEKHVKCLRRQWNERIGNRFLKRKESKFIKLMFLEVKSVLWVKDMLILLLNRSLSFSRMKTFKELMMTDSMKEKKLSLYKWTHQFNTIDSKDKCLFKAETSCSCLKEWVIRMEKLSSGLLQLNILNVQ